MGATELSQYTVPQVKFFSDVWRSITVRRRFCLKNNQQYTAPQAKKIQVRRGVYRLLYGNFSSKIISSMLCRRCYFIQIIVKQNGRAQVNKSSIFWPFLLKSLS